MKVLIVASGIDGLDPFVKDQTDALNKKGIEISFYLIKNSGINGYIRNYRPLVKAIKRIKPDLIHAHYGLSGLLSALQRKVPTIITFHGSDINDKKVRPFSLIAHKLAKKSIFVSKDLATLANINDAIVIPCGVDFDIFHPMHLMVSRKELDLKLDKKYVLFSSNFDNTVKNYPLANESIDLLKDSNVEFLELKGYNRHQVAVLMNAVDIALMTSFTEGSPQFIKEAMACNLPIVSVDVGDVKEVIKNTKHCHITSYEANEISKSINSILKANDRSDGREKVLQFDNKKIAMQLIEQYKTLLK